jgi:hypothetical protein
MSRSKQGRGLFYSRDSGGKHETTPAEYVLWAQRASQCHSVTFDGTAERIEKMIRDETAHDGDLFFDLCVQGHILSRAGLDALIRTAIDDLNVSHVLIPRRDRLARPEDPLDGVRLETQLRKLGLTLVFMDKVLPPLVRGRKRDLGEMIVTMLDYNYAGEFRRELAEKVILAQIALAKGGFSTGGRPPFGFRRWLVRTDGTLVQQLADRETIRRPGHHVVWVPSGDESEWALIRRILSMLETMPATQVAVALTAEGIPSPDAGRTRKDRGIVHPVSGVWHGSTINNIARNRLLLAVVAHGRRSMGDQLRLTPEGPRELDESDHRTDGKPKVIRNGEAQQVTARAHFEPLVDLDRHDRLMRKLDERAGTQRGKPRSRNPARNPLGCRVFDLACGWPMYRTPNGNKFRYVCGLYQQSHSASCEHNHVDGLLATRFALSCLVQKVLSPSLMVKLNSRLQELANSELPGRQSDEDFKAKENELAKLERKIATAKRNLALADTEAHHRAVAGVLDELETQKADLEAEVASVKSAVAQRDAHTDVQAALAVLDRLPGLVSDHGDLAAIGEAFRLINVNLFLGFRPVQAKKRILNKLARGIVTFGSAPPPIELYSGPTGRRGLQTKQAAMVAASPEGDVPLPDQRGAGREGKSLGNVNRGDRI